MRSRFRFRSVLKFALAAAVLGVVLHKAELPKVYGYLSQIELPYLLGAFVCLNLAQVFSGLRMRYYFQRAGLSLSRSFCIVFYYVGMFYTFIFPGGLGGDAYKLYLLRKRTSFPVGKGIKILLVNRANGLLALILMMLTLVWFTDLFTLFPYMRYAIYLGMLVLLPGYFWASNLFFNETPPIAMGALKYSIAVQGLTVASVAILWAALGDGTHLPEYVLLFLVASIIGVLPISIGGLGIREMTFFYGATLLDATAGRPLDPEFGVALSLSFFAINALSCLIGMVWINRIGEMEPKEQPA